MSVPQLPFLRVRVAGRTPASGLMYLMRDQEQVVVSVAELERQLGSPIAEPLALLGEPVFVFCDGSRVVSRATVVTLSVCDVLPFSWPSCRAWLRDVVCPRMRAFHPNARDDSAEDAIARAT
ncbi:MAG: hypothetical protein Q7V62_05375, partial [Actinomycetota bacterium]|nr:hypothetical protein [Actinomycetota bacterium]